MDKVTTKRCSKCGEIKEVKEFSPQKQLKDGHSSWCHLCKATGMKQIRKENPRPKKRKKPLPRNRPRVWYYKRIWLYTERRKAYRKKYGSKSEKFIELNKGIRTRLHTLRAAIKRIDKRQEYMDYLNACVQEFTGISVKNSVQDKTTQTMLAKRLFFKYGIEDGMWGSYLGTYVGMLRNDRGAAHRLIFTRSFKTNLENKATWYRFQIFMKEQKELKREKRA